MSNSPPAAAPMLAPFQSLPTSGARALAPFERDGVHYLAVAQFSADVAGEPPYMNGGNSDIDLLIFRHDAGRYQLHQRLPVCGGEDAEFFTIGERAFLATASLRTGGAGAPYELNVFSTVYEWRDGGFVAFQQFPTFAAKQWRHVAVDGRHLLCLAQGVTVAGAVATHPAESAIFAWDGAAFRHLQHVPSAWGYNWAPFSTGGRHYLAYADHAAASIVLRWNGASYQHFQTMEGASGRDFCFFEADGDAWLVFARLQGETVLYRMNGDRFDAVQVVSGPGGRALHAFRRRGVQYVALANFLTGSPAAPNTALRSALYRFEAGQLRLAESFATLGAVDVRVFDVAGSTLLGVAESLDADVRFRTDSHLYRFTDEGTAPL